MQGYKTWLGVIGFVLLAVYSFVSGNIQEGIQYLTLALGLLGIGGKLDKIKIIFEKLKNVKL